MPVYNGARYLRQAVDSILSQTFPDFELLIVNDGSTDETESIIAGYTDPRIRLINQTNHGVVYSRNVGIESARGTYIASMDADDISAPERLAREVGLLESHPRLAVVGTSIIRIDAAGRRLRTEYFLPHVPELLQDLAVRSPFASGTTVMRTDLVRRVGGYRQEFPVAEDYDLWRRLATVGELANIIDPLYMYRENPDGLTATDQPRMNELASRISREILNDSGYRADIPLRRCLASYRDLPEEARTAITARIVENYFQVALACARRGGSLQFAFRFVKLLSCGRAGLEFVADRLAKQVRQVSPSGRKSTA